MSENGAIGWFDSYGKYRVFDYDVLDATRYTQLDDPNVFEMREVVNLEKNGAGPTVFVESERDWFN